jgi:UDP-GlcNAc:undecaprenyl-phosphate GlcNAc-1-phosphate transferase
MIWVALSIGAGALIGSALLVRILRPLAFRTGLVDHPDARKRHVVPTPAIGGLAIFIVVILLSLVVHPLTPRFLGLDLAALVVVIAGAVDDHRRLGWRKRMIFQAIAGLILAVIAGLRVTDLGTILGPPIHLPVVLSVLLTVIATVGTINAINMIDGVDGLAGGASLATLLMLTGVAASAGDGALTANFAVMAGAVGGFLIFNIRWPGTARASVFLGNAGAELLGLLLVAACLRLTQEIDHPLPPKVAPFLLAPALVDCLTVIVRRIRRGASPFLAGRDHLHEILLDAGLSVNGVVAVMSVSTLAIGVLALLAARSGLPDAIFTLAFLALWLAYGMATRARRSGFSRRADLAATLAAPKETAACPESSRMRDDRATG